MINCKIYMQYMFSDSMNDLKKNTEVGKKKEHTNN